MKRSLPLIVTLTFVSGSLSIVAAPRCAFQRKQRRAKAAAAQASVPVAQPMAPAADTAPAPAPMPAPAQVVSAPAPVAMAPAPKLDNNRVELGTVAELDAHLTKHPNVVAIFTTTWCVPCKALKPVLEQLITENKQVMFVYVDGDKFQQLVTKYKVPGFPTLKFFRSGKEVSKAHGGSKEELQGDLTRHFNVSPTAAAVKATPASSLRQDSGGQASQEAPAPAPAPAPVKTAPAAAPAPAPTASNHIVLEKAADFNAHISKNGNVVGVFSTTWCGPCKALKPVLEELVAENKHVTFVYVDGDNFPGLVSKYAKIGFPTLKFFKKGKEVGQAVGGQSKAELQNHLKRHFIG